jgi:uncharacterized SAM-binding protein YcdF (DUF218 family)
MYLASKILTFLTQPLAWVFTLFLCGLLALQWRKPLAKRLLWAAFVILTVQGWQPLPDWVLRQLEAHHAQPQPLDLTAYRGIVVLGGAMESATVWESRGPGGLNGAAERMTESLVLMRQAPHLQLIFTGGEGELFAKGLSEAARGQQFYNRLGLSGKQLIFESASRNTYENAVFSARLPGVDIQQPWLLLTSAWHMPRAMALFQATGWNVTAYPVDYRTSQQVSWWSYSLVGGAMQWKLALHELAGLLAYRLIGVI